MVVLLKSGAGQSNSGGSETLYTLWQWKCKCVSIKRWQTRRNICLWIWTRVAMDAWGPWLGAAGFGMGGLGPPLSPLSPARKALARAVKLEGLSA